jgi:hypothetical protein
LQLSTVAALLPQLLLLALLLLLVVAVLAVLLLLVVVALVIRAGPLTCRPLSVSVLLGHQVPQVLLL